MTRSMPPRTRSPATSRRRPWAMAGQSRPVFGDPAGGGRCAKGWRRAKRRRDHAPRRRRRVASADPHDARQLTRDPMQFAWEHRHPGQQGVGEPLAELLSGQNKALIANMNALGAGVAPTPYAASEKVIKHLEGVDEQLRARINDAYSKVRNSAGRPAEIDNQAFAAAPRGTRSPMASRNLPIWSTAATSCLQTSRRSTTTSSTGRSRSPSTTCSSSIAPGIQAQRSRTR